ncbi:MAG: ABC transporter ATP-binding protein [Spirochaetales bacterium]|nr:ABC transporter ATP-binding protein [Spirochaetales bacterium]
MLIRCANVSKSYFIGRIEVRALTGISLDIEAGSFIAIVGPSGSGKSTLMNIIGCLDVPTEGSYFLDGIDIFGEGKRKLSYIRNKKIGFIFQNFNLLPRYNVYHNVELPLIYSGLNRSERKRRVHAAIEQVGLSDRIKHRPNELSGGEKQRVAIARALVNEPAIILADEPTGNLDTVTGGEIIGIFRRLIDNCRTIILVTHDIAVSERAERQVMIVDGRIRGDERS